MRFFSSEEATPPDETPTDPHAYLTWHHPKYLSHTDDGDGPTFQFSAFTGDEAEPQIPSHISRALSCDGGDAGNNHLQLLQQELYAARVQWRAVRGRKAITGKLTALATTWQEYQTASKQAQDAFNAMYGTPDNYWKAALLALVNSRSAALDAATCVDRKLADIQYLHVSFSITIDGGLPTLTELAADAGIDLPGLALDTINVAQFSTRGHDKSYPRQEALIAQFAQQEELLREVSKLAGDVQD